MELLSQKVRAYEVLLGIIKYPSVTFVPVYIPGLPWWLRWQRIHLQCGRPRFDPWLGKIPWRKVCQPIPIFLPGESPWTEELLGYSPWCCKEPDVTERLRRAQRIKELVLTSCQQNMLPSFKTFPYLLSEKWYLSGILIFHIYYFSYYA